MGLQRVGHNRPPEHTHSTQEKEDLGAILKDLTNANETF